MKRLEQLPEIANRQLGGLTATPQLRAQIERAATQQPQRSLSGSSFRGMMPALAACAAFVICLSVALLKGPAPEGDENAIGPRPSESVLQSRSAGDGELTAPQTDVTAVDGAVTLRVGGGAELGTLFAPEQNGNFPMILANGAAYRLLTAPAALEESLLGDALGEVTEYTLEPALSSGGIASNTVAAGETVYAVSGMNGALAAAPVNGALRVFQRVSFAGTAILGDETLASTLAPADSVTAIELVGQGAIDDAKQARALVQTLYDNAVYQSASVTDGASLILYLDNGLALQLSAGDDTVSACGSWSCPEFFEAFLIASAFN